MNSQITLLAFGAKCGAPVGGAQMPDGIAPGAEPPGASALTMPSRCSMAPRASPAKPIPTSARKARLPTRPQQLAAVCPALNLEFGMGAFQRIVTKSL